MAARIIRLADHRGRPERPATATQGASSLVTAADVAAAYWRLVALTIAFIWRLPR